ncbi:MAG: coproporphyrinogen dehydrogenase HemZ, partial [Oscillospiraceae bacterium]
SKMDLAIQTASYQNEILLKQEKEYYSLFIFIPFCPSRCKYCSFVSNSISKTEKIENEYINNLIKELEFTAQNINKTSKIIHTIYVGGGTPTSISDDQLLKLVKKIKELFLKNLNIEYTFEAGRADSITKKKLEILKEYGVNRISINPQTFNDTVLKKIKRNHTSKEVVDTFEIARNVGFNNVNMDFIAGLEDETFQSFQQSLIKGCSLNPENITIHTLAIKKSAQLKQTSKVNDILSKENLVQQMVDFSQKYLYEKGYHPYYLYRQKNTIGNFENVGFSKQGFDCVYNIIIMEEIETIIACGAGASSKIITDDFNNKKQIKRIYNYKYPF